MTFEAIFFALVQGTKVAGQEQHNLVLCSFGTMYQRQLVSSWTMPECLAACRERCMTMRSKSIPHDAFILAVDGNLFLPMTPYDKPDSDTARIVKHVADQGLTFRVPEVWQV